VYHQPVKVVFSRWKGTRCRSILKESKSQKLASSFEELVFAREESLLELFGEGRGAVGVGQALDRGVEPGEGDVGQAGGDFGSEAPKLRRGRCERFWKIDADVEAFRAEIEISPSPRRR